MYEQPSQFEQKRDSAIAKFIGSNPEQNQKMRQFFKKLASTLDIIEDEKD